MRMLRGRRVRHRHDRRIESVSGRRQERLFRLSLWRPRRDHNTSIRTCPTQTRRRRRGRDPRLSDVILMPTRPRRRTETQKRRGVAHAVPLLPIGVLVVDRPSRNGSGEDRRRWRTLARLPVARDEKHGQADADEEDQSADYSSDYDALGRAVFGFAVDERSVGEADGVG